MSNNELIALVRDITVAALNGGVIVTSTDGSDTVSFMQDVYDKLRELDSPNKGN